MSKQSLAEYVNQIQAAGRYLGQPYYVALLNAAEPKSVREKPEILGLFSMVASVAAM